MSHDSTTDDTTTDDDLLLLDVARGLVGRHGPGWSINPGEFWCRVTPPSPPTRGQGWKLHVSATPMSAPIVLARAAPVLLRHGCAFKFAGTIGRSVDMVARVYDRGFGGKFLTAYPDGDDDTLRALATELDRATTGLPGPGILSDRPIRLGSLVHYRFGVFGGALTLTDDGRYEGMLVAPDGSAALDRRLPWFSPPPWAPPDPFRSERAPDPDSSAPAIVLNDRYVVRDVLKHALTGGVYRATDLHEGTTVIVKQARRHTGAHLTDADVRTTRRSEADMLRLFADSGRTPRLVDYVTQQGDEFLVEEEIAGTTLRRWVADTLRPDDGAEWGLAPATAVRMAGRLMELVELVHRAGFVLRDFTPNNVMVTADETLRLVDLEYLARPGEVVVKAFTPAYAAPEHVAAEVVAPAPEPSSDLYSLGATLFHLTTGVDPLLARSDGTASAAERQLIDWYGLMAAANPAARQLAPVVEALLRSDPAQRPGLSAARDLLVSGPRTRRSPGRLTDAQLDAWIDDGIDHLVAAFTPDAEHAWPTGTYGSTCDPVAVHHGGAGVLQVLTTAYRTRPDAGLRDVIGGAAGWVADRVRRGGDRLLPGLYFGRSGTAWALLEAGRLLGEDRIVEQAVDLAAAVPLRWPNLDVCHGVAGAGFAQLHFWTVTEDELFRRRTLEAAEAVAATASRSEAGLRWRIPPDSQSMLAGVTHYGYAHGLAGIGSFLLVAADAGEPAFADLAGEAAEAVMAVAEVTDGAAYWRSGDEPGPGKTHWCSGSSGVGSFLVQVWRRTGDPRCLELARQAAVAVRRSRWYAGTAQCHGLAGDGDFLLDLAEATGDDRYRAWARELALSMHTRTVWRDGRRVTPDETGMAVTADYGTGLAGVLAYLLRLRHGGGRSWVPVVPRAAHVVPA